MSNKVSWLIEVRRFLKLYNKEEKKRKLKGKDTGKHGNENVRRKLKRKF